MASQYYCLCLNVCLRITTDSTDNTQYHHLIQTAQREFAWNNGIILGSTMMAGVQIAIDLLAEQRHAADFVATICKNCNHTCCLYHLESQKYLLNPAVMSVKNLDLAQHSDNYSSIFKILVYPPKDPSIVIPKDERLQALQKQMQRELHDQKIAMEKRIQQYAEQERKHFGNFFTKSQNLKGALFCTMARFLNNQVASPLSPTSVPSVLPPPLAFPSIVEDVKRADADKFSVYTETNIASNSIAPITNTNTSTTLGTTPSEETELDSPATIIRPATPSPPASPLIKRRTSSRKKSFHSDNEQNGPPPAIMSSTYKRMSLFTFDDDDDDDDQNQDSAEIYDEGPDTQDDYDDYDDDDDEEENVVPLRKPQQLQKPPIYGASLPVHVPARSAAHASKQPVQIVPLEATDERYVFEPVPFSYIGSYATVRAKQMLENKEAT